MKFFLPLLILTLSAIQASVYSDLKGDILSLLKRNNYDSKNTNEPNSKRHMQLKKSANARDEKSAKDKATILRNVRKHEKHLNTGRDIPANKITENVNKMEIGREYFHMDPVLNDIKRKSSKYRRRNSDTSSSGSSSSIEMKFWMDEWDEHWMQKKFEALNSTQPRGDVVNMVAARPWGVACGDPNQHDMPWGSCMLPQECDAEYRVYRGDYFCGRTQFVCCALQLTNYDMYQGLDISFDDSGYSTDSKEKDKNSRENNKRKRRHERKARQKERAKRKKKIKKTIRQIISEIRKILNRAFRNGTAQRKRKTRELKKFIEALKRQYRKERKAVVNVHEFHMVKIDKDLQSKLDQIKEVNQEFMTNDTFRDIIVNGTVNKEKLMQLLRANENMAKIFAGTPFHTRRSENLLEDEKVESEKEDLNILEYDLEYGQLYY